MRSESLMWRKVRPVLFTANPIHPGTPDVNLCDGRWIELKTIAGWPARADSPVRIPHYTPQQRVWLYRRWKYSPGSTLLLLEVRAERQWLLFDGDVAAKMVARTSASDHRARARGILAEDNLSELPRILAMKIEPRVVSELSSRRDRTTEVPELSSDRDRTAEVPELLPCESREVAGR